MKNYEKRENMSRNTEVISLPIAKLRRFENHPYKVVDNEEMASLVDSIYNQDILTPITVRPLANGEYEIVSGHRRVFACNKLGMFEVPAVVRELTREEAIVVMADSNLHRDGLLPSEKAFAYKMKLDAIKRQGERTDLTSDHRGQKSLTAVRMSYMKWLGQRIPLSLHGSARVRMPLSRWWLFTTRRRLCLCRICTARI